VARRHRRLLKYNATPTSKNGERTILANLTVPEQELTALLELQRAVCHKLGIDISSLSEDVRRLMEETDVHRLAATLDRKLPAT
jgi:hypothetical protein